MRNATPTTHDPLGHRAYLASRRAQGALITVRVLVQGDYEWHEVDSSLCRGWREALSEARQMKVDHHIRLRDRHASTVLRFEVSP